MDASDSYRSNEQIYKDHDFSIKLGGGSNYIVQYSDGNQAMAGGFENGKAYKLYLIANLVGLTQNDVVVKLISSPSNFNSDIQILGPNPTWQVSDLGGGWKKLETSFINNQGRFLFKNSKSLAVGTKSTSGSLYLDEVFIGEDLGSGRVGPKVVISDKQDFILHDIDLNNGIFTYISGFNEANFYAKRGYKVRRLQEYYWRYLAARWGYSRGVHSWELLNEGAPGDTAHYDQTTQLVETIRKYDRNHAATPSFWTSFPVSKFWGNLTYSPLDYADVHAYVSSGWIEDASLESDEAKYHIVYSDTTRDWLAGSGRNMPIVRGEAGLDFLTGQK